MVGRKQDAKPDWHGFGTQDPLGIVWRNMKRRCLNPEDKAYPNYGDRGITISRGWIDDFAAFKSWSLANGYFYGCGLTLDRINNEGNYTPRNCRWTTYEQQARNTRRNPKYTAWGETKTVPDWVDDPRCIVGQRLLRRRIQALGWEITRAMTEPPRDMHPTECPQHHLYVDGSFYLDNGTPKCKQCCNERKRVAYQRRKENRS